MKTLLLTLILLILNGCVIIIPEKSGGPCRYDTFEETARVVSVEEEDIYLMADSGKVYARKYIFDEEPKRNERFKIIIKRITKGTCTPVQVVRADKITD